MIHSLYAHLPSHPLWLMFGFIGQFFFTMRFIWQWLQSEKQRKSVIPVGFWYFSLGGGLIVSIYAIHLGDPVIIIGQVSGLFVYLRNLYFIQLDKKKNKLDNNEQI